MKFAIVGTNFISDKFCEAAKLVPGAETAAVFSRAYETGKVFAERHSIAKVYTDYRQMLADPEIDAVYIASPTMCHSEQAILALEAGLDVLCEKMIAASYPEFLKMKEAAKKFGKQLIEAMRPDFDEILLSVSKELANVGKISSARFEYCQYSSRYDRFKAGEIMNAFDPTMKNSALADIGIYPLHYAISLFGAPDSISSEGEFLHNGFLGSGKSILNYGDFEVEIVYSKTYEGKNVSYIAGEDGKIFFDKINEPTYYSAEGKGCDGAKTYHAPDGKSNMVSEIAAFIEICRGNSERGSSLLEVTGKTMAAVDSIYRELGIDFDTL